MPLFQSGSITPVAATGQYIFTSSPGATATSAALGNGNLRVIPWLVTRAMAIDRIAAEIVTGTTADAGAKYRLGIYADNGNAYPGALLLDAGQIAADVVAVAELTVALTLPAGLYWIGGAVQSVVTTQPTVRTVSNWTPPVPIGPGTSAPAAGTGAFGYTNTGVTAALPATFTATVAGSGNAPRCHVRAA